MFLTYFMTTLRAAQLEGVQYLVRYVHHLYTFEAVVVALGNGIAAALCPCQPASAMLGQFPHHILS